MTLVEISARRLGQRQPKSFAGRCVVVLVGNLLGTARSDPTFATNPGYLWRVCTLNPGHRRFLQTGGERGWMDGFRSGQFTNDEDDPPLR